MDILDIMQARTSYRGRYKNTPVPKSDLHKIMQAGLSAPSGGNRQTTSLIAVDDPAVLTQLYNVITPPIGITAPVMICVLTQKISGYRSRYFNIQDYSAAIENMLLAIVGLGYESCWVEGYITDSENIGRKMADILNVPQDYELVCFLPVGCADEETIHPQKKDFSERAWFNGFRVNDK